MSWKSIQIYIWITRIIYFTVPDTLICPKFSGVPRSSWSWEVLLLGNYMLNLIYQSLGDIIKINCQMICNKEWFISHIIQVGVAQTIIVIIMIIINFDDYVWSGWLIGWSVCCHKCCHDMMPHFNFDPNDPPNVGDVLHLWRRLKRNRWKSPAAAPSSSMKHILYVISFFLCFSSFHSFFPLFRVLFFE